MARIQSIALAIMLVLIFIPTPETELVFDVDQMIFVLSAIVFMSTAKHEWM